MLIRNLVLATMLSSSVLSCGPKTYQKKIVPLNNKDKIEQIENSKFWQIEGFKKEYERLDSIQKESNSVKNQISLCLNTDNPKSFTHTKVLETIPDFDNPILEFPLSQLYKTYWNNKNHPLVAPWVNRNFQALLWVRWAELSTIPQKLAKRDETIQHTTRYSINDTLRFSLKNYKLEWVFPDYLSDQLKESGFETFSNPDSEKITEKNRESRQTSLSEENENQKSDFIYDIAIKSLPDWKSALAVYRDWKLFMTTYVSVWLKNRKTKTWQFEIIWKMPYYRSRKYKSPMPYWLNFDLWWFFLHQWNVSWNPASHWCVRLPWVYASILYYTH